MGVPRYTVHSLVGCVMRTISENLHSQSMTSHKPLAGLYSAYAFALACQLQQVVSDKPMFVL
eukprot:5974285-Amphidinium_carterae.1